MTSLGRSIGRKGRLFLFNSTNRSSVISSADRYTFSSFNSSRSAPFLHFSRCNHTAQEGGEEGGSPLSMIMKAISPWNVLKEPRKISPWNVLKKPRKISPWNVLKEPRKKVTRLLEKYVLKEPVEEPVKEPVEEPRELKVGDTVKLSEILFTKDGDYLIKCSSGQEVKQEQLAGKTVVIYFDSILNMDDECLKSLTHIYKDLQPDNNLEVIFVDTCLHDAGMISPHPIKPKGELHTNKFPTLPWIAIPLSDVRSRTHLRQTFGVPSSTHLKQKICTLEESRDQAVVVINPDGIILHWRADNIISEFGADGYPFTKERIDELTSEDDKDVKEPSLNSLLASSKRDYLISNKGDEVPIHTLKDKVVALFFYTECGFHREFAEELKVAYEELRVKNEAFEVVLIYLYDTFMTNSTTSEETFSKTFKTMPWLALPFGDSKYYKLKRFFLHQWLPRMLEYGLVVIGPNMNFINHFGLEILKKFKSPAYPFSCERVAELAVEKVKELELKMLWHPDSVFGGKYRSEEVKLDQFVNKNVIVLYDCYGIPLDGADQVIQELKERYESMMGTNDEFKVIDITSDSPNYKHVENPPWDVVHLDRDYKDEPNLFGLPGTFTRIPSLLAFDRNGRIVRKTMFPTFDETEFPFYSGGMEKEALSQLTRVFEWDWMQDVFPTADLRLKV